MTDNLISFFPSRQTDTLETGVPNEPTALSDSTQVNSLDSFFPSRFDQHNPEELQLNTDKEDRFEGVIEIGSNDFDNALANMGKEWNSWARISPAWASIHGSDRQVIDKTLLNNPNFKKVGKIGDQVVLEAPDGTRMVANKKGFSARDVTSVVGSVQQFAPVGKIAMAGKSLISKMFRGAFGSGATSIANDLSFSQTGQHDKDAAPVDLIDTGLDTAFGAGGEALGAGLKAGGKKALEFFGKKVDGINPEIVDLNAKVKQIDKENAMDTLEVVELLATDKQKAIDTQAALFKDADNLGVPVEKLKLSFPHLADQPSLYDDLTEAAMSDVTMDLHKQVVTNSNKELGKLIGDFADQITLGRTAESALTEGAKRMVKDGQKNASSEVKRIFETFIETEHKRISQRGQELFGGIQTTNAADTLVKNLAESGADKAMQKSLEDGLIEAGEAVDLGPIIKWIDGKTAKLSKGSSVKNALLAERAALVDLLPKTVAKAKGDMSGGLGVSVKSAGKPDEISTGLTSKVEGLFNLQSEMRLKKGAIDGKHIGYKDGVVTQLRQMINRSIEDTLDKTIYQGKSAREQYRELIKTQESIIKSPLGSVTRLGDNQVHKVREVLFESKQFTDESFKDSLNVIYQASPLEMKRMVGLQITESAKRAKSTLDAGQIGADATRTSSGAAQTKVFDSSKDRLYIALDFLDRKEGGSRKDVFNFLMQIGERLQRGGINNSKTQSRLAKQARRTEDIERGLANSSVYNTLSNWFIRGHGEKAYQQLQENVAKLLLGPRENILPAMELAARGARIKTSAESAVNSASDSLYEVTETNMTSFIQGLQEALDNGFIEPEE